MGVKISIDIPVTKEEVAEALDVLTRLGGDVTTMAVQLPAIAVNEDGTGLVGAAIEPEEEGLTFESATPFEPVVPLAPPAPAAVSVGVELDSAGYPHDERIHQKAGNKVKATGKWKLIKNIGSTLVTQVRAEYDASKTPAPLIPPTTPRMAPPVVPPAPPAPVNADDEDEPPVIPGFNPSPPLTYSNVMDECVKRIKAGTMELKELQAICRESGLAEPSELAAHRDLIPAVNAKLEALWHSQGTLG